MRDLMPSSGMFRLAPDTRGLKQQQSAGLLRALSWFALRNLDAGRPACSARQGQSILQVLTASGKQVFTP